MAIEIRAYPLFVDDRRLWEWESAVEGRFHCYR